MNKSLVGRTIHERYHIVKQIGRGGSGITFIAEDIQCFNSLCVVKQLKPQTTNPETTEVARRLFALEAEILGKLGNHECIPLLLAYFEEDREFYLVQELIEGQNFIEEIIEQPYFSQDAIVAFLEDVLETLVFIQEYGVIHRDINPSNLIRRKIDNRIVLIDFGSVKQVLLPDEKPQYPDKPTVIVGTDNYIPIEQIMGNPNLSSDVYALGIVAIQALTGKLPRDLPMNPQGELIWHERLQNRSQYDPELLSIIDKAIRYQHQQRYESAREFLDELRNFQDRLTQSNFGFAELLRGQLRRDRVGFFKSKAFRLLSLFVAAIVAVGIYANFLQPEKIQYLSYEDRDYGIKVAYPENWKIQTRDDFLMSGVIFISPPENEEDNFRENVSIFVENLVSPTSLSQYTEESLAEIKRLSDPNISDARMTVLGSNTGSTVTYEGEENNMAVKRMQIWTVSEGKAYTITYTATPDRYEAFLPTVKQIIATFDLL